MFQLTRPRGARRPVQAATIACTEFQLTRPRGARLTSYPNLRDCESFNSRARVGRDSLILFIKVIIMSFNSRARVGRDKA